MMDVFDGLFKKPTTGSTNWGFRDLPNSWKEASRLQRFMYVGTFTLEIALFIVALYEEYGQRSGKWAVFFFCIAIIFAIIPVRHGKRVKA